jgi:hypothetical protein
LALVGSQKGVEHVGRGNGFGGVVLSAVISSMLLPAVKRLCFFR